MGCVQSSQSPTSSATESTNSEQVLIPPPNRRVSSPREEKHQEKPASAMGPRSRMKQTATMQKTPSEKVPYVAQQCSETQGLAPLRLDPAYDQIHPADALGGALALPDPPPGRIPGDDSARWNQLMGLVATLQTNGYPRAWNKDAKILAQLLDPILVSRELYKKLLESSGDQARRIIEAMQWLLDVHPSLGAEGKRRCAYLQALIPSQNGHIGDEAM